MIRSVRNNKIAIGACFAVGLLAVGLIYLRMAGSASHAFDTNDLGSIIESKESEYNNIYIYKKNDLVTLTFGQNNRIYGETVYNTADQTQLLGGYTEYMTAAMIYPKRLQSVLEIGSGGARTAWYLHHYMPDVSITTVELDPAVSDLARKYFGVHDEKNFRMVNQDGRLFLTGSKEHYDVILIDAYRGPFVPFHLLTKEFYQLVKDHLNQGGAIAQNVASSTMLFDSAVRTINSVFPNIDFYVSGSNVVTIAYDGQIRAPSEMEASATGRQNQFGFRYVLPTLLAQRRPYAQEPAAIDPKSDVLTDDFAPVDSLKSIEEHNRKWSGRPQ